MINPQVWNELLLTAGNSLPAVELWKIFHREWSGTLQFLTKTKGNNYFLPTIFGGLGLDPPVSGENGKYKIGRIYDGVVSFTARQKYAVIFAIQKKVMPRYATRLVSKVSNPSTVERTVTDLRKKVLRQGARTSDFEGTARVKGVTDSTKLKTYKLPNGSSFGFFNVCDLQSYRWDIPDPGTESLFYRLGDLLNQLKPLKF
jgi:hypothetical protein